MLFKSSCYPVVKKKTFLKKYLAGVLQNPLGYFFFLKHTCTVKGWKKAISRCMRHIFIFLRFMSSQKKKKRRGGGMRRRARSTRRRSHGDDDTKPRPKRGSIYDFLRRSNTYLVGPINRVPTIQDWNRHPPKHHKKSRNQKSFALFLDIFYSSEDIFQPNLISFKNMFWKFSFGIF